MRETWQSRGCRAGRAHPPCLSRNRCILKGPDWIHRIDVARYRGRLTERRYGKLRHVLESAVAIESLVLEVSFRHVDIERSPGIEDFVSGLNLLGRALNFADQLDESVRRRGIPRTDGDWEAVLDAIRLHLSSANPFVVQRMHYGSPWEVVAALGALGGGGVGGLLFAAKRLFAVDLDLKAYREGKAAEYHIRRGEHITAKAVADALEELSKSNASVALTSIEESFHVRHHWAADDAVLTSDEGDAGSPK